MTFYFFEENESTNEGKIVLLPKAIIGKKELFNVFALQLNFPSYFGENWDALYDCLSDLSWMSSNVTIIHSDMPFSNKEIEKKIYIELLMDVIQFWENTENDRLRVMFPIKYKLEIENLLKNSES